MTHKVMNCKDFEEEKFVPGSWVSKKYDGVRAFYYPAIPWLISRDNKPLLGFEHIIGELERLGVYDVVDMELVIPGYDDWNKMAGQIRNHQAQPDAIAHIIDIPSYSVPWLDRMAVLKNVQAEHLVPTSQIRLLDAGAGLQALYELAIEEGQEGLVIKTPNHMYRNTRSYDWMRMVPFESEDVVVDGIYEGKGKFQDAAGGFTFMLNGIHCKCGTMKGITIDMRKEMFWFQDEYIGRTAEIHFKEYQPSGKPRQPRFKGWRDDK